MDPCEKPKRRTAAIRDSFFAVRSAMFCCISLAAASSFRFCLLRAQTAGPRPSAHRFGVRSVQLKELPGDGSDSEVRNATRFSS